MSEFLKTAEQQLTKRGHQAIEGAAAISASIDFNGISSEMRFRDINGQFGICSLDIFGLYVPPDMEAAMTEVVMLLNKCLDFTTAIYDPVESSLGSRASVLLLQGTSMIDAVEQLIVNVETTARHILGFAIPVLARKFTPADSLASESGEKSE